MIELKRYRLFPALSVFLATVMLFAAGYAVMNARSFQFFGRLISRVDTAKKVAFLTFDDGPTENAGSILRALDELDVKASFFLIGEKMEENPAWAKAILESGHDIGNHTYSHPRMVFHSLPFIQSEVDKTNAIIRSLGYRREIFFRPPGCKKLFLLPWHLGRICQTTVTWTLEPESCPAIAKDAQSMADYTIRNISNGAIILLHPMNDGTGRTIQAIKLIVSGLRDKGYTFERLSDVVP